MLQRRLLVVAGRIRLTREERRIAQMHIMLSRPFKFVKGLSLMQLSWRYTDCVDCNFVHGGPMTSFPITRGNANHRPTDSSTAILACPEPKDATLAPEQSPCRSF